MIKTPVSYSQSVTVFYPTPQVEDANGEFLFELDSKENAEEIVKRINMHDEFVDMIGKLLSEIDACDTYSVANQATIFMAEELLERCE